MISPQSQFSWSRDANSLKRELMYPEVVDWLDEKQKNFILDYVNIKEGYKQFGITNLSDYSYLVTPAFKALEGILIQIATELGFEINNDYRIGAVFDEEKLNQFYTNVIDKVEGLLDQDKEDIKMWLNDARRILRHFRHSPAHFNGDPKQTWNQAFQFGDHIISVVNELCRTLLKANLLDRQ